MTAESSDLVLQAGTVIEGRARCAANLRQERPEERAGDGNRLDVCMQPPGWKTDHPGVGRCTLHGGNTPTQRQAALATVGEREIAKWGARRDISAPEALLELVQWKATEVQFWQSKVDGLADEDMTWGTTKEEEGVEVGSFSGDPEDRGTLGVKTTREAVPHIYIKLLHDAQKALADFCASALRAGADAALVNLAQSQASLWLGAMRRMLADSRVSIEGDAEEVLYDALKELRGT